MASHLKPHTTTIITDAAAAEAAAAAPSTPRSPYPNPNPTTFVQADTSSFKQVVQMLTGTPETAAAAASSPPPSPRVVGPRKPYFKLYERRSSIKSLKIISPLLPASHRNHQHQPEIMSPSRLEFPSLSLSPVTPLIQDPFCRRQLVVSSSVAEERGIAEKGFYLHPSPRGAAEEPPRLLTLFPLSSPRSSSGSSSLTTTPSP